MQGLYGYVVALGMLSIFALIGLVFYLVQASAIYKIAKRRGIRNAGLAFVPIAESWILGSIADQYTFVSTGARKNTRKVLLGLNLGSTAVAVLGFLWIIASTMATARDGTVSEKETEAIMSGALLLWFFLMILLMARGVFELIACYRLFQSCVPYNATLYLVLMIFVSVTKPFLVFSCRNRDDGMYPLRQQYPGQPPMYGAPPAGPGGTGFQPPAPPMGTMPTACPGQAPQQPVTPPPVQTPPEETAGPGQDGGHSWL